MARPKKAPMVPEPTTADLIRAELEQIRSPDGILRPHAIVAFAENPETALHSQFEWDDTEAARQYRLIQARNIIRLQITVIPHQQRIHRMYVSLSLDRVADEGGYRVITDVLSDADLHAQYVADALSELERVQAKYADIQELEPIRAATRRVRSKMTKKADRKAA